MFSSGGISNARTGSQSYGVPKGLSFRIFKGSSLSSNFPSHPSGYAAPGPYTNATAHFDVGYHSIPATDPVRSRRTSLYQSRATSPGLEPPAIPVAASMYPQTRDHQNMPQFPRSISSASRSSSLNPSSASRSNSNSRDSTLDTNPSSTKNQRQFSIYASNTNKDTYIYEASDACSNSEYSSPNVTSLSPSGVFSPALSTDSTVTLRSPLSTSSLLEAPERSSDRTSRPQRNSTSFAVPPLAHAQDTLRNILGTSAPSSQNQPSRASPPDPRRRDSINLTSTIPFGTFVSNDAGRFPTVSSFADDDVETESDRIAQRNAVLNAGYSSYPGAFEGGRRRTLSTLSNISSTNISTSADISSVPVSTSYFPPPEPLPVPPRPASRLSRGPDSTEIHVPSRSSIYRSASDPVLTGYEAYADSASSSTAVDHVAEHLESSRFFDEIPLRSSPVEITRQISPELINAMPNDIYATNPNQHSPTHFVSSATTAPPASSFEGSNINYSPPGRERGQYHSHSSTSSSPPFASAPIAQNSTMVSHSPPQSFQFPTRASMEMPTSGSPSSLSSGSSATSSNSSQYRSGPTLNFPIIHSSYVDSSSTARNSFQTNAGPAREAGSRTNGVYSSHSTAPEKVQPAYTSSMMMQPGSTTNGNPPTTTVEQTSSNVQLTSHNLRSSQPSRYSQHIPHLDEMNGVSALISATTSTTNAPQARSGETASNVNRERKRSSRSKRDSISVTSRSDRSSPTTTTSGSSNSSNSPPLTRAQVPVQSQQGPMEIYANTSAAQSSLNRTGAVRTRKDSIQAPPVHQAQLQPHVSHSTSLPREAVQPAVVDSSRNSSSRQVRPSNISSAQAQVQVTSVNGKREDRRGSTVVVADSRTFPDPPPSTSNPASVSVTTTTGNNRRGQQEALAQTSTAHYPGIYEPRRRHTDESNPSLVDATRRSATPFKTEFAPSVSNARAQTQGSGKPEPVRSFSDGDQIPLAQQQQSMMTTTTATVRITATGQIAEDGFDGGGPELPINPAQRTVRWNQRLICPSPIRSNQRRKGWFNRRGDQLWTNGGLYKSVPPGEEYPVDLDDYPEFNEGWMNEEGKRIDMAHRLIPKTPLRSALKRTSQA